MGIEQRLRRLEAERGPNLCEERFCMRGPTFVEVIHYPDGSEERVGREPSPLCTRCPYRDLREREQIRVVEVVKHY
jgi:hypothetical protein